MDPDRELERRARRHGVEWNRAKKLLPLARRAAAAHGDLRRNLLAVLEGALVREAEEVARRAREQRCLVAVAAALHRWGKP
jgi:hypothetical protein